MEGLIHLYCGDGKGKTTAAVGLSVRAAGAGLPVVFAQFFKTGSSGEISLLRQLPGVRVLVCAQNPGRFSRMTEDQRSQARENYAALLESAWQAARENPGLLVLDECISACNHGLLDTEKLAALLDSRPAGLEVALTGRNPPALLADRADYITEMRKLRHPFDQGIRARRGIEF